MASVTVAKQCVRLAPGLTRRRTVLIATERLISSGSVSSLGSGSCLGRVLSLGYSPAYKIDFNEARGLHRLFSLSARDRNDNSSEMREVETPEESISIPLEERSEELANFEERSEELVNFDHYSGEKRLCYEDGVPDVLYRGIEVKCLAHEPPLLDSYQYFVEMTANGFRLPVQVEEPCRIVERKTVLRSAFVHKDIRTQYEWYTHYRLFRFTHLTGSTADTLLEYLQRNLPEGMAMEVTKKRVERLPVGVEASKGETPSKEDIFGGRKKYEVDTVAPKLKPDPATMPDGWDPRSCDEKFRDIPV